MRILVAILKRALQMAVLSLAVTSVTFLLSSRIPGDIFSAQEADPTVSRQTIAKMRQQYGLDRPVLVQYGLWLRKSLYLDFGESIFYRRPVRLVVLDALGKTLWLGVPALFLGLVGGVLLGVAHSVSRSKYLALALDFFSTVALALPTVILGLGALLLASNTSWFPIGSMSSFSLEEPRFLPWLMDRGHHLVLPVACLALPILAYVERIQYAATRDVLGQPYLRGAAARGLSRRHVFVNYILKPALNPILSVSGPILGSILSGSLVLEVIFAWPGLGQVTYDALFNRDLSLVAGCVVGSTVLLVLGNLAADTFLLILDPRTRSRGGT